MLRRHTIRRIGGLTAALLLLAAGGALAQPTSIQSPFPGFVLTGYGTSTFANPTGDGLSFEDDVTPSFAPVLLYNPFGGFMIEAEFEIEREHGEFSETIEYFQANYAGLDRLQFTAGKFLLPIGVFGERLHPTWINKLPTMPGVYGHGHGGAVEGALLPILNDVGLMARFTQPMGGGWSFKLTPFVSLGPEQASLEDHEDGDDHEHGSARPPAGAFSVGHDDGDDHDDDGNALDFGVPGVAYGANSFSDNNDNKMLGGRLGFVQGGSFEAYVSGFHAMYDDGNYLDLYGTVASAEWRPGAFELRGEGLLLWQEFQLENEFRTRRSPGYYLQATRRVGDFEPVLRWSHLLDATVGGQTAREEGRDLTVGLDYWFTTSVPIKAAYEIDLDGDDRVLLQWAYGF